MFAVKYALYVVAGLTLGIIVDYIFKYIKSKLTLFDNRKLTNAFILLLQLIVNGIILYFIMLHELHDGIINTLPGIIFPVLFFGIQYNIYTTIQEFIYN